MALTKDLLNLSWKTYQLAIAQTRVQVSRVSDKVEAVDE
jgi:hypothetical protein